MKKHIIGLLSLLVVSLLVIPSFNLMWSDRTRPLDWTDPAALYNVDFGRQLLSDVLVPLGISIDPTNVIIGRNGWFFLGDSYATAISEQRRKPNEDDRERGRKIAKIAREWQYFLCQSGVKAYKIIVGPNKSNIYAENSPLWTKAPTPSVTDAFMHELGEQYVDVRQALAEAKTRSPVPLYFATDSHWNSIGAGVAFRTFAEQTARELPDVRWPAPETYLPSGRQPRLGGDLAAFLNLQGDYTDWEELPSQQTRALRITQIDWRTGKPIVSGPNQAIPGWSTPILVRSPDALNMRKVLWLRDSFGTKMSPYMSQTFSDVLQLHWSEGMKPEVLRELVDGFKPDYVFVTVVEREARSEAFSKPLLLPGMSDHGRETDNFLGSIFKSSHDVVVTDKNSGFAISGPDPSVFFDVPEDITGARKTHLMIDLRCQDRSQPVKLQLFWSTNLKPGLEEARSVRLIHDSSTPLYPLTLFQSGHGGERITKLRVDLDSPAQCSKFNLAPPALVAIPEDYQTCN